MTGWPLVVCRWLTWTVQSFPYRRVLPGPAGFNINTELWRTEAPALGPAPGGLSSTFNSPFSLLIYRPQWLLVDPFPLSVCSQGTPKTVLQQYICFMISWGVDEEKTSPTPLPPGPPRSTAPVPVNVHERGPSASFGLGALGGGMEGGPQCHKLHVYLPFPSSFSSSTSSPSCNTQQSVPREGVGGAVIYVSV